MSNKNHLPSVEQVRELTSLYSEVAPAQWEDENGHINVTYYMDLYNRSGWPMFAAMGINKDYFNKQKMGVVDLENNIRYFRELHVGDKVSLYRRFLAADQKRIHGMMIIVNDNNNEVSCSFEFMMLSVDLSQRKSAPWPEHVVLQLDNEVAASQQLNWHFPTVMSLESKR